MIIKGWVKNSLIDFPGHIATVVFTGGCNFRCPYCHNGDLVQRPEELPDVAPSDILDFLAQRRGFVDGVVLTGGEPTLTYDTLDFARAVQELGMAIKLDTNGSRPAVLARLLAANALDYIAMDIKAPLDQYPTAAGVPVNGDAIQESVELVRSSGLPYEYRTTVVPGIVALHDIAAMAQWIAGARVYVLQQFRPSSTLAEMSARIAYPRSELERMAAVAERWVERVEIRDTEPENFPIGVALSLEETPAGALSAVSV